MYQIHFSENCMRELCLSTIEAYVVGDLGSRQIETIGGVWGYTQETNGVKHIKIELASECLSAERTNESVAEYDESINFKKIFLEQWSPELRLIGDFHTHPYETLTDVKHNKGWEFSDTDFDSFLDDDLLWDCTENPLMIVMSICKLQKIKWHDLEFFSNSLNNCCFSVGQFRFWINVCLGYRDESNKKCHTGNYSDDIFLWNPMQRFSNFGERRLKGIE